MPLPRPASPRALWSDLRDFFSDRPRHSWIALTLAVGIAGGIMLVFHLDSRTLGETREQVYFLDSWPANRTDTEIVAKQKADQAEREAAAEAHRQRLQRIDQELNRLGI